MKRARCPLMIAVLVAAGGCTVGPTYRRPAVEAPDGWSADAASAFAGGASGVATTRPFDGTRWWSVFADPTLDKLIQRALAQNLDVQTAGLRIAEARAQRDSAAGAFYPDVGGTGVAGRARLSENGFTQNLAGGSSSGNGGSSGSGSGSGGSSGAGAPTFNVFQLGFDALWELDLFGKTRRNVEAAGAEIDSAEAARRAALVSLCAEVARNYFSLRGAERRLAIAQADIETQQHLARLITSRNQAGLVSTADIATQTAQVAAAQAQIAPLEQAIGQARNRLALLLALPPGGVIEAVPPGALPLLPPQVPVGLPAELLRRRPDVAQREADLHSATARIGVATAQLFPSVRLGVAGGLQSAQASNLLDWSSRFLLGGTQVTIPIFEGGRLRSQVRVADLQQQQAVLAYRQAVLNAFHEVDDALIAYDAEQRHGAALQAQFADAVRSRELAQKRYEAGFAAYINVLDAERTAHQAELALAQARVDATTDLVALFKALGGGWAAGSTRPGAADAVDQGVRDQQ